MGLCPNTPKDHKDYRLCDLFGSRESSVFFFIGITSAKRMRGAPSLKTTLKDGKKMVSDDVFQN